MAHIRSCICIDTDSHIQIRICMRADCKYTDCMFTSCIVKDCMCTDFICTKFINTNNIHTDCMCTGCINVNCITMDCISANHVDICIHDTNFCNTLNRTYKYAQVMSSLDFDNVKSNKSSQSCKYRTSLSNDGVPDKLSTRTCNSPIDSKFPLKKIKRY
jgi:hypothetical protein